MKCIYSRLKKVHYATCIFYYRCYCCCVCMSLWLFIGVVCYADSTIHEKFFELLLLLLNQPAEPHFTYNISLILLLLLNSNKFQKFFKRRISLILALLCWLYVVHAVMVCRNVGYIKQGRKAAPSKKWVWERKVKGMKVMMDATIKGK